MIMKCKEETKYVVIRLTEDILIDNFAILNKEFYSSNFKVF